MSRPLDDDFRIWTVVGYVGSLPRFGQSLE